MSDADETARDPLNQGQWGVSSTPGRLHNVIDHGLRFRYDRAVDKENFIHVVGHETKAQDGTWPVAVAKRMNSLGSKLLIKKGGPGTLATPDLSDNRQGLEPLNHV
jgi:hypothetical protein